MQIMYCNAYNNYNITIIHCMNSSDSHLTHLGSSTQKIHPGLSGLPYKSDMLLRVRLSIYTLMVRWYVVCIQQADIILKQQ